MQLSDTQSKDMYISMRRWQENIFKIQDNEFLLRDVGHCGRYIQDVCLFYEQGGRLTGWPSNYCMLIDTYSAYSKASPRCPNHFENIVIIMNGKGEWRRNKTLREEVIR